MQQHHKQPWWFGAILLVGASWAQAGGLRLVEGVSAYNDAGFVRIAGEIHNESAQAVCSPQVDVLLKNKQGQALNVNSIVTITKSELGQEAQDGVVADRYWLKPGEVAVFTYRRDIKKVAGQVGGHQLKVRASACTSPVPKVVAEDVRQSKDQYGYYTIQGKIHNVGQADCRSPRVVFGLYGADGRLVESTDHGPESMFQKKLRPGASVAFERKSMSGPEGVSISQVKVWADCDLPE